MKQVWQCYWTRWWFRRPECCQWTSERGL